ncbi:MAG: NAD(P)-dependent oxidoreductase [Deferrisomatales bacterium]|nr:NAD(P)-dependent oxidoreductase [Deferrisomatales bacterium]
MSRILVTGGKGFLGQHVVARLREDAHDVQVFARPEPSSPAEEDGVFWGDIRDGEAVDAAVRGSDVVIHLVSNFRKGGSDKKEARAINVNGTVNVLEACGKHGVRQLIHCSTIGVHGSVREIPATETTAFNPTDLYQETKLEAEQEVWRHHREKGLPVTVIRPISLYGPGDLRMLKLFKMIKKGTFLMVGSGDALFQPAYIDDVVEGFRLCLENPAALGEVFILGSEGYLPLKELVRTIAEEMGVAPPTRRIPLGPVLWLAGVCERVCEPFGIEPPLHRRRVSFFQNNRAFSIEKAKRVLGFDPQVPLREGIRRTVRWYEENGYL